MSPADAAYALEAQDQAPTTPAHTVIIDNQDAGEQSSSDQGWSSASVTGLGWPPNPLASWLLFEGWRETDTGALIRALGLRMRAEGVPVYRLRLSIRFLHPQMIGVTFCWDARADRIDLYEAPHGITDTDRYRASPYAQLIDERVGAIRRRLELDGEVLDFPILHELRDEGATDYVALPLEFSDGNIHVLTLATDQPGGFPPTALALVYDSLPVLARIVETHTVRRTAVTLLDTYLGHQSGTRVLEGQVKRGDGETIKAVIWFCDMRDSTPLSNAMPREEFLRLLNSFFEAMAGAVLDQGGEVLRYIGDAVLAIFPLREDPECWIAAGKAAKKALAAAQEAMDRMEVLNRERQAAGLDEVRYGIGLHVGEVMYGNIGAPQRLEFSVIGAAANEAARIEGLTKTLNEPVVVSQKIQSLHPGPWRALGSHSLRGVTQPVPVYAPISGVCRKELRKASEDA